MKIRAAVNAAKFAQESRFMFHRRPHFRPTVRVDPKPVVAIQRRYYAVFNFFKFRFKGSEHSVPTHQNTGIVLIQILRIYSMMNPMVRRRIENILDRFWKFID